MRWCVNLHGLLFMLLFAHIKQEKKPSLVGQENNLNEQNAVIILYAAHSFNLLKNLRTRAET